MKPLTPITVKNLYARCRREGDCLVWTGPMSGTVPQVYMGERKYVSCRRCVIEGSGDTVAPGLFPVNWCRTPGCIKRQHLTLMTTAEIGQLASREGKFSTPERAMAITLGRRKSGRRMKLDLDKVADIKACPTAVAAAAKHRIDKSMAARIRKGDAWREALPPAPPPIKVQLIPRKPDRFEITGPFEGAITKDWMQRRQQSEITT